MIFKKKWDEQENEFGDLNKEFWYGLCPIHSLSNTGKYQDGWMDGTTTVTTSTITMIQIKWISYASRCGIF